MRFPYGKMAYVVVLAHETEGHQGRAYETIARLAADLPTLAEQGWMVTGLSSWTTTSTGVCHEYTLTEAQNAELVRALLSPMGCP
jgi:hypothetical protein